MKKLLATYENAMAAGQTAGERNMRRNGRKEWNEDDWNVACDVANIVLTFIANTIQAEKTVKEDQ